MKIGFVSAVAVVIAVVCALGATKVIDEEPETYRPFPIRGSYLHFYRDLTPELWAKELDWMRQLDMDTIVIVAAGRLKSDKGDPLGFSLAADHLIYPSQWVRPDEAPAADRLNLILTLANQRRMNVYVGLLQTESDWTAGTEFAALLEYDRRVAAEIVRRYGHHRSLRGWYFPQEIWMNRVRQNGPDYYGTALLRDFVADLKALDPAKRSLASVVFKTPDLSPDELQHVLTGFLEATRIDLLLPQDGAGAGEGAASIEELPAYFRAMATACGQAGTGTELWATTETFTAKPNVSNDRFPPAEIARIQRQLEAVRPYVTGSVSWIFANDMSPQATYYPVEASALHRAYRAEYRPLESPSRELIPLRAYEPMPPPSLDYLDSPATPKLADRTGGGYSGSSLADWVGFRVEDSGGTVRILADLGGVRSVRLARALTQSWTESGIFRPRRMTVEASRNGADWQLFGSTEDFPTDTSRFAVMWGEVPGAADARYLRYTFNHQGYLFLAELEVLGERQ